jgi:uncharacterized protein
MMDKLKHISDFITQHHLLTLCTHHQSDMWCANCYYVFDPTEMKFIIMSDQNTRHGQLMLNTSDVAGTIATEPTHVSEIQGVQFSGQAIKLADNAMGNARDAYFKQFPIAKNIPSDVWIITINEIKMTDNRIKFGFKCNWKRNH